MWGWVLTPKWRERNKQLLLRKCKVLLKAPGVGKANYVIQSKLLEMGKCVTVDNVDVFEEKSSLWNSLLLCGRQQGVPAVLVVFLHCSSLGGQEQFVSAWQHLELCSQNVASDLAEQKINAEQVLISFLPTLHFLNSHGCARWSAVCKLQAYGWLWEDE